MILFRHETHDQAPPAGLSQPPGTSDALLRCELEFNERHKPIVVAVVAEDESLAHDDWCNRNENKGTCDTKTSRSQPGTSVAELILTAITAPPACAFSSIRVASALRQRGSNMRNRASVDQQ